MTQQGTNPILGKRITVIDALRGFALFGVMWIHMQQRFGIFSGWMFQRVESATPMLDGWINWLTSNVFMGRFINIFAFLFGMSFFIQMDRAHKKGIDFRKRFLWRMVILAAIGVVGSWFTYLEILTIYAFFGVLLILLFPLKNKVLMVIFALILAGGPRWAMYGYDKLTAPAPVEQVQPAAQAAPAARAQRPMPQMEIPKTTFWTDAKNNMTSGFMRKVSYQFGMSGRGYLTFALFILGLVVGRIRFFEHIEEERKQNVRRLLIVLGCWAAGILAYNLIPAPQMAFGAPPTVTTVIRATLSDINMVLMSTAITLAFVLLYGFASIRKGLDALTPYGRMGLTNYELQGIIGAILFSTWAFGSFISPLSPTLRCLIGILFYVVQMVVSKWWLSAFKYGPWEWGWRGAAYLDGQPFVK